MSYFGEGSDGSGADYQGFSASTPLLYDIAAMQAIYGVDRTTRTDSTVYGFNSNAGKVVGERMLNPYSFDENPNPVFCIWDAGGANDTIDASGFATTQRINLGPGEFSSIGDSGMVHNVSIAFSTIDRGVDNTIENAIGGSGNDEIRGNHASNILNGGGGNDTLYAGVGVDTLIGGTERDILYGSGDDILQGGTGNDTYYVIGLDDVREDATASGGTDTVHTSRSGYSLKAYVENLIFDDSGAHTGDGNSLGNTITGKGGVDTFYGHGGIDRLYGGGGADTLNGGANGDWLYGQGDNDKLYGDAGNDTLVGGAGKDTLTGGADADIFDFNSVLESQIRPSFVFGGGTVNNVDTITDFVHGVDKIDLLTIDANSVTSTNDNFTFLSNLADYTGSDWTGKVWFEQEITSWGTFSGTILDNGGPTLTVGPTGTTTLFASTDADATPEFQVTLTGIVALTTNDFVHDTSYPFLI